MSHHDPDDRSETLVSACDRLDDRRLYFGRLRLAARELRVRGWSGVRPVSLRLSLDDISAVDRVADGRSPALTVTTGAGRVITLGMSAPGLWRWAIRSRLPRDHEQSVLRRDAPAADRSGRFVHTVVYDHGTRPEAGRDAGDGARQAWRRLDELVSA